MARFKFNPNVDEFINKYKELESSKLMAKFYGVNNKTICSFAKRIGYKNTSKNNYWKPISKSDFIEKYDELKSAKRMAVEYNVGVNTILNYAKKINYTNKYRVSLTEEEKLYICDNYMKKTSMELSEELKVSPSLIKKIWRENDLKGKDNRTYYMDFNYFQEINTNDKAYFLGVIAADACVYNRNNHQGMLSFKFHVQEKDIIDSFLLYTQSNYVPIISNNYIGLQINSDKIVSDLKQYNIIDRKTKVYEPYMLSDNLMWHYLRGYFDGDGSIYHLKDGNFPSYWTISYCGNEKTMKMFQLFLEKYGIESRLYKDNRDKYNMDFFSLRIRKNISKKIFLRCLYESSEKIRLNRKYIKSLKLLELLETPS